MTGMEGIDKNYTMAVAIPCYNEALTIAKVIKDFKKNLPAASIYVFDNNSTDRSVELAEEAGAVVCRVKKQGKGYVMQAIFGAIDADVLIVVDGDDTYYAEDVHKLLEPILKGEFDMAVGNRLPTADNESMRRLHQLGNRLIVYVINFMFRTIFRDILSGFRVFSRRFVRNVPLLAFGFETETELTLQALERGMEIIELPIRYRNRPEGSKSKLRSFSDGRRIIVTAAMILREHQPIRLFGTVSLICFLISGAAAFFRVLNYMGFPFFSNTILTGSVMIFTPLAIVSLATGLILSAINTRFREMNQILNRRMLNNDRTD